MNADTTNDWTSGPAKWAAVAVLGAASIGGLVWSNARRVPAPWRAPAPVATPVAAAPIHETGKNSDAPSNPTEPAPPDSEKKSLTNLNLNTATAAQLELLPEVGPALAKRIVEYRDQHGPFRNVDALDAVKGIGSKTLARIRPYLTIE